MFIRTRYHGPTNARGSRISATTISGQRVYVPYDHALSTEENHDTAARELVVDALKVVRLDYVGPPPRVARCVVRLRRSLLHGFRNGARRRY